MFRKKGFTALMLMLMLAFTCALAGCSSSPSAQSSASAAASASSASAAAKDMAKDPTIDVASQAYWRETLQKYRTDDNVHQILLVRCTGECAATVQFYEKLTAENNVWSLSFEGDAIIGKNGIGKQGEGDAMTPVGDFGIRRAFGIRNNPGTAIDYLPVTETTYACDEDCEFYNQIIDTAATGHDCKGEEMFALTPEYNYGLETDFNNDNTSGAGSAIFIHCKGTQVFRGGCVALDEEQMKTVLQKGEPSMRIIIHPDTTQAAEEAAAAGKGASGK